MIEVWGGVECTVNRVRNEYFDQLTKSGHDTRLDDLRLFKEIGLNTLRFPVIWEKHAPKSPHDIDWTETDKRLGLARELGLRVIVGFVHHGSGPRYTDLLDPEFDSKLAVFARAFAERFPWVEDYTPINEPLTTARFSGLYGCWYPHHTRNRSFLRMLWNECKATRAAMRAIREVNSKAKLIQTDDLGKIFSTSFLAYQAKFENRRRWLGFDILTGRLTEEHALYKFCVKNGLKPDEIAAFANDPCPPDIIGINHYITSNRFLDERLERYPRHVHGGNKRHRYADIEAVRVGAEIISSPKDLLKETWDRYQIPIAMTEVHLGCTREEQMRWFDEIWRAANELKAEGVDIRAVTAWSLLGAFDWNSLVTRNDGIYESGIFDLRGGSPRPTQLAAMIKSYSQKQNFDHPVLDEPGWWRRPDRLLYPSVNLTRAKLSREEMPAVKQKRRLLILGGKGSLTEGFAFICERRALPVRVVTFKELAKGRAKLSSILDEVKPWAIINTMSYRDDFMDEPTQEELDIIGAHSLEAASYAARSGARIVHFSSEKVFSGQAMRAYHEEDEHDPSCTLGKHQSHWEKAVRSEVPSALVIRTSALFGPWDEVNFLTKTLRQLAGSETVFAPHDVIVSPTYLPHLCDKTLDLMIDGEEGVWHITEGESIEWTRFARMAAEKADLDPHLVCPVPAASLETMQGHPRFAPLESRRVQFLQDLDAAVETYRTECRVTLN